MLDAADPEPPVPPGLANLSTAQRVFVDLLGLEPRLVRAAATHSPAANLDLPAVTRWIASIPAAKKDVWLRRAVTEPDLALGHELRRAFREKHDEARVASSRTVGALRASARGGSRRSSY